VYISHSSTSSTNPLYWGDLIASLEKYFLRNPIEQRVFNPSLVMYKNMKLYRTMFKIKRKLPMMILYNLSRVMGTKNFKDKIL
jgi:hypothetical protein